MATDLLFSEAPATSASLVFGATEAVNKNDLVFSDPPAVTGNLVFGADAATETVSHNATVSLNSALPELLGGMSIRLNVPTLTSQAALPVLTGTVEMRIVPQVKVAFSGVLPGLIGTVIARYDSRTERPFVCSIRNRWQDGDDFQVTVKSPYHRGLAASSKVASLWSDAAQLTARTALAWKEGSRAVRPSLSSRLQEAERLAAGSVSSRFQDGIPTRLRYTGRYEEGSHVSDGFASSWQEAYRDRRDLKVSRYEEGIRLSSSLDAPAAYGDALFAGFGVRYQPAMRPPAGMWIRPVAPPILSPCYTPIGTLLFEGQWATAMEMVFICERHGTLPPAPGATVVVPILRTYVTINSIALRRVDGNLPIPTHAFGMSLDADSWTWSWSASIPLAALPLVQPGSDGEPVEVEAMVNGVPYRLYAEGVSSQRQFHQARIAVKGRGKAAMLDAPYAPVLNFGNLAARTAQQLMTDILTVNGVGIGWAVDWNLTDWLVPGNTWTSQGSYIGAVINIAQAAGGYVQPHDTDQTLRILPRYPAAPWDWASVTPDFELPSSVVTVEGIDWTRKANYNRVFVSGMSNGVLGQVTRAGTAGDSVAPMVTDALITHADAARQRGVAILSDTGNQARVTLTLPVLAETGLIKPGQFVRYLDGRQTRLGLVRSNSLAWSRPKLRQTISVETHA